MARDVGSKVVYVIAALVAIVLFLLTPYMPTAPGPEPNGSQMIHLMVLGIFEVIAFAAGIIFAYKARRMVRDGLLAGLAYLSIIWWLISWWPHFRAHVMVHHGDFWSLIWVEWIFHVTLELSAIVVAVWAYRQLRRAPVYNHGTSPRADRTPSSRLGGPEYPTYRDTEPREPYGDPTRGTSSPYGGESPMTPPPPQPYIDPYRASPPPYGDPPRGTNDPYQSGHPFATDAEVAERERRNRMRQGDLE